ncbi:MAG: vWA domain-containing protein [Planctomycetota bacterium]
MNEFLDALFGLSAPEPRFTDPESVFAWAEPMSAWIWVMVIAALGAAAGLTYSRLKAPAFARAALAVLRTLTLVALVAVIAGPRLERERTSVERDWAIVLADRSASMTIPDAGNPAVPVSRDTDLRATLDASQDTWTAIGESKRLVWLGFDATAYDLEVPDDGALPELAPPAGRRTRLGVALDEAMRRAAARPVAGLVVFSDGRSTDEPTRATMRRLASENIAVFVVPLGSPVPIGDVAIRDVQAPPAAFKDDVVPIRVRFDAAGDAEATPRLTGTVRLIDNANDEELASAVVGADQIEQGVTLEATADADGPRSWRVVFEPDGRDLLDQNNTADLRIQLVDRPLRVLYIDGYPRWEHRYLKTLLLRETSIESSSLLLAPDRRYQQEGDIEIERLPRAPEEWRDYDVVIIGDVRADLFGREQLEALLRHVAETGGGVMWIAGPNATPRSWAESPLDALLPVNLGSGGAQPETWTEAATIIPAPAAERLGVLALPPSVSDPDSGWSRLRYVQRLDANQLKPGVEVLATSNDPAGFDAGLAGTPSIVTSRYGAGRVIYVATDETWRYRFGTGEAIFERFWLPLVRLLARERLALADRPAVLTATPDRAVPQQPVVLELTLLDPALLQAPPASLVVEVRSPDGSPTEITLSAEGTEQDGPRLAARYASAWVPSAPGEYLVRASDPLLAGIDLTAEVRVTSPEDELRTPATDFAALERLAETTGGEVLTADRLSELPDLLPNRRLILAGTPETTTLWDRWPILAIILVFLTLEWVGRRLVRLA